MDIEVVEFYPHQEKPEGNGSFAGSLHVYIIDHNIDLRGIYVSYDKERKNQWRFTLPTLLGLDQETKEKVRFPAFQYADKKKTLQLMKQIRYRGKPYIQKNFLGMDVEQPAKAERKPFVKKPFVKRPFDKPYKKEWSKKERDEAFFRNR